MAVLASIVQVFKKMHRNAGCPNEEYFRLKKHENSIIELIINFLFHYIFSDPKSFMDGLKSVFIT